MLNEKIRALREELSESVINGSVDYDEIYRISVKLDKLINEYYCGAEASNELVEDVIKDEQCAEI